MEPSQNASGSIAATKAIAIANSARRSAMILEKNSSSGAITASWMLARTGAIDAMDGRNIGSPRRVLEELLRAAAVPP